MSNYNNDEVACEHCRYWRQDFPESDPRHGAPDGEGICHLQPPRENPNGGHGFFVVTTRQWFCSNFKKDHEHDSVSAGLAPGE